MLVFVHIPKTAGTSFRNLIMYNYGLNHIFHFRSSRGFQSEFERFNKHHSQYKVKAFVGHTGFGVDQYLTEQPSYFTILRHPVERIISHYFFALKNSDEFSDWELFCNAFQNFMTRYLSGLEFE